jgi:hypothetical protein
VVEPVISGAVVTPGHDGEAQLLVHVRYENGATGCVTLGPEQARRLMERCRVERAEDLCGVSWEQLLDPLPCPGATGLPEPG